MSDKWISVNDALPKCPRGPGSLGVPVLIWPRNTGLPRVKAEGFAYFGRRLTIKPSFYLYGTLLHDVTHWMPLPRGPKKEKRRVR